MPVCVNVSETLQFSPGQPVSTQLLAAALWPVSHWKLSLLVGAQTSDELPIRALGPSGII